MLKNVKNGLKSGLGVFKRFSDVKLLHLVTLFTIFFSVNLFSMRISKRGEAMARRWLGVPSEESINKKKSLLLFLDDSEKKNMGFIGGGLATALYQEAGPIIVSTSLLKEIFNEKTMWAALDSDTNTSYSVSGVPILKPDRWIVKEISDFLYLLIPVGYLESLTIDKEKVKEFSNGANILSDVELALGFKVNHMKTITYQSMHWVIDKSLKMYTNLKMWVLSYFSQSSEIPRNADYFTNFLDDIFCKKSDYQGTKLGIPEWFIYINGHAAFNYSIADLSFNDFKKLLHFLENKINTTLLVVASCYTGGVSANKIYGEITLETQQYYSFPIIIQTLNNVAILGVIPTVDITGLDRPEFDITSISLQLITHIDFVNFFKKAKRLEGNYSEIIKPISFNSKNIPQIKLPGIEWFSVIEGDKKIVSIGSIFVKTRDFHKPLDIVSFFKKDPEIILLYIDNIPFELVINSSNMKSIISMVSPKITEENGKNIIERVFSRIKKITSSQSFSDILYWFKVDIVDSPPFKIFCIDEIDDKKDIIILPTGNGSMRVYYKNKDGVAFTKQLKQEELEIQLKEIKFEQIDKDSQGERYYHNIIRKRDEYSQPSARTERAGKEISSEQIKEIENKLFNVSEPEVD